MKTLTLLVLTIVGAQSFAGGIALHKRYEGINALSGKRISLELKDPNLVHDANGTEASIREENSSINAGGLHLKYLDYSTLEARFVLLDARGNQLAQFVTEPPCTDAARAALIFKSGMTVTLTSLAD